MRMRVLFWIFGLGNLANGVWMLLAPASWYVGLPADVPDTGPFNEHFVRDIGCAFLAAGAAQLWAAFARAYRTPLVAVAALFVVGHALIHVFDTVRGAVSSDHWWLDLPGVYLPALLLGLAAAVFLRAGGGPRASRAD
jgi:hypothetical protein